MLIFLCLWGWWRWISKDWQVVKAACIERVPLAAGAAFRRPAQTLDGHQRLLILQVVVSSKRNWQAEAEFLAINPGTESLVSVPPLWCFLTLSRLMVSACLWPVETRGRIICCWLLVGDIPGTRALLIWSKDPWPWGWFPFVRGNVSFYNCPLKLPSSSLLHVSAREKGLGFLVSRTEGFN